MYANAYWGSLLHRQDSRTNSVSWSQRSRQHAAPESDTFLTFVRMGWHTCGASGEVAGTVLLLWGARGVLSLANKAIVAFIKLRHSNQQSDSGLY